jgi:predicted amidohydrolase
MPDYVERAAQAGAQLVVFPELYPGPSTPQSEFSFAETCALVGDLARRYGLYIMFGGTECDSPSSSGFNTYALVQPDGKVGGKYRKMLPAPCEPGPPEKGADPVVFRTPMAAIGALICWEAWFPELVRATVASGAEVVVFPTGGLLYELTETWRTIVRARAYENTAVTAVCVNLYGLEDGLAEVVGPEGPLGELRGEGILAVDIDLDRVRELREVQEELSVPPKPYRTLPGLFRSLPPPLAQRMSAIVVKQLSGSAL